MASVTPKVRSRKDGAAIPLDDFDKRLLNAMQGGFPIEPRPYASVAAALGVPEERVLARVGELVDERIIRQITPIFDTRALGYGSWRECVMAEFQRPSSDFTRSMSSLVLYLSSLHVFMTLPLESPNASRAKSS